MADIVQDSILICGQRFRVPGARCVTFADNPRWLLPRTAAADIAQAAERDTYYHPRVLQKKNAGSRPVGNDLTAAREAIDAIVLHADGMNTVEGTFVVFRQRVVSSHFCIAGDGTIVQFLDAGSDTAHHCRGHNRRSVGIDLNNDLVRLHEDPNLPYNYPSQERGRPDLVRPRSKPLVINGYTRYTYGYTDAQYDALIALVDVLCGQLAIEREIPLDARGEVVMGMLDEPEGFRGICAHWHTEVRKWDPGPGFDWQRVYQALKGQHNSFPVLVAQDKNVANLNNADELAAAASELFRNVESGEGGYYPMGVSQNWHGGVHLHVEQGSEVRAMFGGTLVAARFGEPGGEAPETPLGDNNFVLLRHDIPLPVVVPEGASAGAEEGEEEVEAPTRTLTVFSLYMHLAPLDVDAERGAFDWLADVHRLHGGPEAPVAGEEDEEDGADRFAAQGAKPYLETGGRLAALRAGKVALFDWEEADKAVRVSAGHALGRVGRFREGEELRSLVHLELFADASWKKAIDLAQHSRFWAEVEEDIDTNLRVETEDVLGLFRTRRRRGEGSFFRPARRELDESEIRAFFQEGDEEARRWLRTTITCHVSEWSDRVDWVRALSEAQELPARRRELARMLNPPSRQRLRDVFSGEIKKFLPFIWLDEAVAQHIGLDLGGGWNGLLHHFHPLHFLYWLSFYANRGAKRVYRGKSYREMVAERRREQELEKAIAAGEARLDPDEAYGDVHDYDDDWLAELEEDSPDEILREFYRSRGPDEWDSPERE